MKSSDERPVRARRKPDLLKMLSRGYISAAECRILGRIREGGWTEETAEQLLCGLPMKAVISCASHARDAAAHLCVGDVEKFVVLVVDSVGALQHAEVVSQGSARMTVCDVPQVLRVALAVPGSAGVIIAHNHPSGRFEPSEQDIDMTRRVKAGCTAVGLRLLDALVIGWGGHFMSFAERGIL